MLTVAQIVTDLPPKALTAPCQRRPAKLETTGDLVEALVIRESELDECDSRMTAIRSWRDLREANPSR